MVLVFMSNKVSQSAPPVARMYPTNGMGVVPVSNSVDPNYYLSQDELLLYTPFMAGPDFRKKRINQLQYLDLSESIPMDGTPGKLPEATRDNASREKFYLIGQIATQFWPQAKNMYLRILQSPKRDMGHRLDITPEIGVTITPPKREIGSPTLKPTNTPPKPR